WLFAGLALAAALLLRVAVLEAFAGRGVVGWSSIKSKYSSLDEEDLLRYCFSSAYIVALLHDSLGIGLHDARIMSTNEVDGTPLDWALGAFILQATAEVEQHREWEQVTSSSKY
ncbi:Probable apyrase 6, partial [Dionaea muscipula]